MCRASNKYDQWVSFRNDLKTRYPCDVKRVRINRDGMFGVETIRNRLVRYIDGTCNEWMEVVTQ